MANKISNLASIAAEIKKAAELAKKNNASKPVSGTTRATTNTRGANNLNYSANRQTSSPDFEGIRAAAQTARGANNPNYNANRTATQTSQNTMPSFTQSDEDRMYQLQSALNRPYAQYMDNYESASSEYADLNARYKQEQDKNADKIAQYSELKAQAEQTSNPYDRQAIMEQANALKDELAYSMPNFGQRMAASVGSSVGGYVSAIPTLVDMAKVSAQNKSLLRHNEELRNLVTEKNSLNSLLSKDPTNAEAKARIEEINQLLIDAGVQQGVELSDWSKEVRENTEELEEQRNLGRTENEQFLAGIGKSAAENLALLPLNIMSGGKAQSLLMGARAAADTAAEKTENGSFVNDAVDRGLITGGIEYLTEMLGVDNTLKILNGGGGNLLSSIATQAGAEGIEEVLGYIANYFADLMAKDPNAEFNVGEMLKQALAGAVSGGLIGGATSYLGSATAEDNQSSPSPTQADLYTADTATETAETANFPYNVLAQQNATETAKNEAVNALVSSGVNVELAQQIADKLIADQTARATQESSILNPITNNATLPQITSRDVFNATTGAYEPTYNANPSSVDVTYNEPNFEGIREAANEAKKNKPNLNAISEAVNTMQTASNTQTTPNLDDLYFTQDNLYDENEAPADISDLDSLKTYSSELESSSDYGRLKQGLNKLDSAKDYIEAQRNGNYLDRIAAEREAQATESAVATATPAQESVPTTPKLTEADIPQDAPEEVKTLFNDVISGEIGVIDTPVPVDVAQSLTDKGFSFLKDIWRNVEAITNGNGKALTWFKENILQPLENAKRTRVNNMYTILTAYKQAMDQYGIKKGSKESAATMWLGEGQKPNGEEYTIDNLKTDFPETWQNIVAFEKVNRAIYDSFVERENNALKQIYPDVEARAAAELNSLIANKESLRQQLITQREGISRGDTSYKPEGVNYTEQAIADLDVKIADLQAKIESGEYFRNKRMLPRKNYYRHFQEQLQGVEGLRNILSTSQEIDPDLVAISADTKPKSKWASYMQERKGGKYTADAVSAMLDYVPAAEYKINIDPITARIRGVVTSLAQATKQTVNANKAILFLTRYADSLAGKTNSMDRAVQEIVGRKAMASLGRVNSRVKSNVILGNARSAFTQFANIPNISLYITNPASHIKGVLNSLSKGSTEQSAFLKERYESDLLDSFEPKWTPKQFALKMLSLGDKVGSTIAWNVAYEEAVRTGENDPVSYADNLTRKIVAGRGVGELPLTMQSKVANLLAPFQVEVANTFNAVQDATKSKNAAGKVAGWMASTFVFNTIAEALTGARPLPDMIDAIIDAIKGWDKDKDEYENITDIMARLSGEALSFVPFSSLITSLAVGDDAETLFGEADPTRYGTANIGTGAIADVWSDVKEGDFGSAALNSLDLLLPWGGTQLKRTIEGISTVAKGGEKNANDGLKYSVENEGLEGLGNYITGGLFGKWALDDAKDYIDRGFTALYGAERTVAREQAIANGMSADAFDGYFDNLTGSTQYDALFALASSDLTDSEKETLWNATNSDWQQSYADFYEENKAILDSGLTAEALNEYKQSVKDLTTEEKREQILNDTSLSVGQKNALSSALTGGNVDYTNAETFTVSQLSDKQQYEWDIVKAQGLTLDQYTTALDSYYEGGTPSKDVGIQRLVKAGFTKEWANWFYTYVLNDKSGSASSETPEKREYFINLLTNAGYDESYYDKAYEAYNQYGSKDQRIERIVAEGFTREWAEWFYTEMQKKISVDSNGNYYLK